MDKDGSDMDEVSDWYFSKKSLIDMLNLK
jgi:hypothetical protein